MNESYQGPIDNLLMAKLRNAVLAVTEVDRIARTVPEWFPDATPDEIEVVAGLLSRSLRKRLMPLVT